MAGWLHWVRENQMQSVTGQALEFLSEAALRLDQLAVRAAPRILGFYLCLEQGADRLASFLDDIPPDILASPVLDTGFTPVSSYARRYKGEPPEWFTVCALVGWIGEHFRVAGYEKKVVLQELATKKLGVRIVEFEETLRESSSLERQVRN
jgi:hypothetical protein